eukprot:GFYU01000581.1.p1 GENE.GFYU01000581.1~~GFYU01000581.1.p1  ORF type:complete len:213 (+),score=69.63 GFYU01000581.1:96-641(+)
MSDTEKKEEVKPEETPKAEEENPEGDDSAAVDPNAVPTLPEVKVETKEEDEEVCMKLRAKLYRFVKDADGGAWKERGTGDVKLLKHKETGKCRLLMRQDKTLKICANHFLHPDMDLQPNSGSDKSWVWTAFGDLADDGLGLIESKNELLAIRFANVENATKFKEEFEKLQKENAALEKEEK